MFLSPSSGSGTLRFAVTTNGGGSEQMLETSPLPVGQWRHVALTRNGSALKLYTNGVVAVTNVTTIAPASFNPALNYLGASQYPDPLFNGRLDEMVIYNYALNATEIARLTNNFTPVFNPTNITATAIGSTLNLAWPADHTGWRLQAQTNSLNTGLTGTWFDVAGSATVNSVAVPLNPANGAVFYRMVYP